MALNPAHRPKLEDVLAHPWMQGEYATEDEIQVEFKRRKAIVDEEAHNERENKRKQRDADNKTRVRRGAEQGEEKDLSKEEQQEELNQLRAQYEEYKLNDYDAEIWKKTSFFTSGKHIDLFLDLGNHLDDLNIEKNVHDSNFKIKFDAKPSQAQQIFAMYVNKIAKLPANIQTAAQKALLEKPETQAILNGTQNIEEVKDEMTATCCIELLAVKNIEAEGEEAKEGDESDGAKIACCVDFSYRDKSAKKLDVEKHYVSHFKAWKALLNPWVNLPSSKI